MSYCVYMHTCPNGKKYIGITSIAPHRRWENGSGYAYNEHFHRAIQKYGWENIRHEILFDDLTREEAEQKEIELISLHKSNISEFGYNHSTGGECIAKGCKHTKEMNERQSKRARGENNPMFGKSRTSEEKHKISVNRKGIYKGEEHYFFGQHHSEETARRISDSRKGKLTGASNHKSKSVINLETGKIYESARIAALSENVNYSTLKAQLRKKNSKYALADKIVV